MEELELEFPVEKFEWSVGLQSLKAECGVLRRKVDEPSGEVKIVLDGEEHPK
ncbi:hypothetical protein HK098_000656, partial [Nowakowskiella sp. JEL0407]